MIEKLMKSAAVPQTGNLVLATCTSPASYWIPNLLLPESAWTEHAPFGFWLMDVLRPSTVVELGGSSGFSYFVFCQAVQSMGLDSRCYGVDRRTGDERATTYNETHYHAFSHLIQSGSDQAAARFDEGSIKLLHIDGLHSYDEVKAAYGHWRSRLAEPGVVLFHHTNVREDGFGVAKFWRELSGSHSHFEFLHGRGLGVLGIGRSFPRPLETLFCASSDPEAASQIRLAYSRLGMALTDRIERETLAAKLAEAEAARAAAEARTAEREMVTARMSRHQNFLSAALAQREADCRRLRAEHEEQIERIRAEFYSSTSWRLTRPLRMVKGSFRN